MTTARSKHAQHPCKDLVQLIIHHFKVLTFLLRTKTWYEIGIVEPMVEYREAETRLMNSKQSRCSGLICSI